MATAAKAGVGACEKRQPSWKRRLTIGDVTVAIALLAVDLGLLGATFPNLFLAVILLLALLMLMVGFVWRYVPKRRVRPCYVAALLFYCVFLFALLVSYNPMLSDPLLKLFGMG